MMVAEIPAQAFWRKYFWYASADIDVMPVCQTG